MELNKLIRLAATIECLAHELEMSPKEIVKMLVKYNYINKRDEAEVYKELKDNA